MDRNLFERIGQKIDAHLPQILSDLADLVAVPSVAVYDDPATPYGQDCKKALDLFLQKARDMGFETESCSDRCGTVTLRKGKTRGEEICLWCHLDIVPAGDGWELTSPFKMTEKEGFLIGRGTGDNKGPAIGLMHVLKILEELEIPTKYGLRLCVGCDEEHGMSDVMFYAENYPAARLNLIADGAFSVGYAEKGILEANLISREAFPEIRSFEAGMASNIVPDAARMVLSGEACAVREEWKTVTADQGVTVIETRGEPRHSAHPQGAVNAIHVLTKAAAETGLLSEEGRKVMDFFTGVNDDVFGTELGIASSDEISGQTTCAGTMAGLKDGKPFLHVNIRHCISADADRLTAAMKQAAEDNGCTLELLQKNGPNYFDPSQPVVHALAQVFQEITGIDKQPYVLSGGTYARKLPNAVVFGMSGLPVPETDLFPSGHGGAHQRDEGLYLDSYRKALGIMAMGILTADSCI